jgi:hypothetical protein
MKGKLREPPNIDEITENLIYDKATNSFFWRERSFGKGKRTDSVWKSRFAGKRAGSVRKNGYRVIVINRRHFGEHRLVWFIETGEWPPQIDHLDGDRLNNSLSNLRAANPRINGKNVGKTRRNRSGVVGVQSRPGGSWKAFITVNNVVMALYQGPDFEKAVTARKEAEIAYGFHEGHGKREAHSVVSD